MIDQAFVLGAGLGTRLRPLTEELPKPLVPIFQKPLITFAFDHLGAVGVKSVVVNTHHLPEEFERVFPGKSYEQLSITLVHEPVLLDTGGGIKNVEPLLSGKPFLVYSGDVLTDLPLRPLIEEHFRAGNDVTLALRDTGLASQVAFRDGRVRDIGNRYGQAGNFDYANVSVWNPEAFAQFSLGEKISFIPVLAKWIGKGGRIGGVVLNEGEWFNLGSPAQYLEVHRHIKEQNWRPSYLRPNDWPASRAVSALLAPRARVEGFSVIGADCHVGDRARVEDSILWPEVQIAPDAHLKRCIVRAGRTVHGEHCDAVL
ncbi:MAG: NTP transferase domain-containing protein [Chthoniobacterales bacterium]|nr:NTP transferase domain-containing protein [Chthoniobacterales bacterium]